MLAIYNKGLISMLDPNNPYDVAQVAGGTIAGGFGLLLMLQKFMTLFKAEKSEGSVISMMHTELERMSEQNTKLSLELGKLQEDIIALNKELRQLTEENRRLHDEIEQLTAEISKFKDLQSTRGV